MTARRSGSRTRPGDLAQVRSLVERLLTSIGQQGRMAEVDIVRCWPRAVGPLIASRAMPIGLQQGTLTVGVSGSAWMNQLHFFRDDIAAKVNTCLGREVVTAVKLVLDRGSSAKPARVRRRREKRRVSEDDLQFVDEALAPIDDEQIRESLRRIITRQIESGDAG